MKTNYYYCLFLTNAQGLKPLNGSNYFFPSYIKKWIIYLRGSGLFLSSLSYLKYQKWALVLRHRLREFKHQLSSVMSKPSGISESPEICCWSELMKSVPFPPPCIIYERPNHGGCTWTYSPRSRSRVMSSESSLCENHLEIPTWMELRQVRAAAAHNGLGMSCLELYYVCSSVQPSGDSGYEECQNKLGNKRSKVHWVQVCCLGAMY